MDALLQLSSVSLGDQLLAFRYAVRLCRERCVGKLSLDVRMLAVVRRVRQDVGASSAPIRMPSAAAEAPGRRRRLCWKGLAGLRQGIVKGGLAKGELLWQGQCRCNAGKIIGRSKNGISGSAWIKALFGVRCPARRIGGGIQRCCPVSSEVSSFRKNGCRRTCRFSSPAMFGTPSWASVRLNSLVRMSSALSMPARPAAPAP